MRIVSYVALAASLAVTPASAFGQVTVQQVPAEMDASNQAAWWRPIVVKGSTTVVAFDAPGNVDGNHEVKVGIKSGAGAWSIGNLRNADGTVWRHDDDIGHDQPTVAVDGDGFIHVFADHHVDGWRYFRSNAPNNVSDIRRVNAGASGAMPGTGLYTYPIAEVAPNGDIYLIARNTFQSAGQAELFRWSNSSNAWTAVAVFARENGHYAYPDDLKVDSAGDVHIAFEWSNTRARPLRHYGSYLKYVPSANQWRTANGVAVNLPATRLTPNILFQGLSSGEQWNDSDAGIGIQATGLAVDANNRPSIAYRYRTDGGTNALDFDVYRVRWDGGQWTGRTKIYTASNNVSAAIETTHNGIRARVYFAVTGTGVMGADSSNGWSVRALAPSRPGISRLSAGSRDGTTDVIYGAAPTEISSTKGRLYVLDVGATLP